MQTTQNIREQHEQRQFGAMFVCFRETRQTAFHSRAEVLLIADSDKKEVSAGFTHWSDLKKVAVSRILSFPAGGRSMNKEGILETRDQTVQSELFEELGVLINLQILSEGIVQEHPFIVGQLRDENDQQKRVINQFGVTSILCFLDQLPRENQIEIEQSVAQGNAFWAHLDTLEAYFTSVRFCQVLQLTGIRPQTFTAAHMWWLQAVQKWSNEAIVANIAVHNKSTHDFIYSQSESRGIPVKNGAFSSSGVALSPSVLSAEDAAFLYPKKYKIKTL